MANKYAVASGSWSSTSTWSDSDGGGGGATVPADGDTVFISAGVAVLMDVDQSAFTGLLTVTIRGAAGTPGQLHWANGTNGWLKVRTGYNIVGTSGTNKGRLLANSNGTWGGTTALQASNTAMIDLQGTAKIDCQYLDVALYGTEPTNKYVRTYATKYDFNAATAVTPATDVIDLGTTPPSAGTAVCIVAAAGATLPTGLEEDYVYYVRSVSGNTCKLATQISDTCIVDITAVGSGTCSLVTGHTNTGTATMNVLEDVTSDTPWTTTASWNRAALVDWGPTTYDQQRVTLSTITATTITLSENVDSAQYPCARIYLCSRNVTVMSAGTSSSQAIFDYASATTSSGVFQCAIVNTGGSGTTFYGQGVAYGQGHTVSGVMSGCTYARTYSTTTGGGTISGQIVACSTGVNSCYNLTISGGMAGCSTGINSSYGCTMSGEMFGCGSVFSSAIGCTVSGTVRGGATVLNGGLGYTISGSIVSVSSVFGNTVTGSVMTSTGRISGCASAISGAGHRLYGVIEGCATAFSSNIGSDVVCIGGSIGYRADGTQLSNVTTFTFPLRVELRGTKHLASPTFGNRNTPSSAATYSRVISIDHQQTAGAYKEYHCYGTVTKQSGTTRSGGAATALQVDPETNCGAQTWAGCNFFEWTERNAPAAATNRSVYIRGFGWTGFPSNSELYIEAEYISNATTYARTTVTSTATISDNTTWVEFTLPEFTPAAVGDVTYRGWLKKYEASSGIYVDAPTGGTHRSVIRPYSRASSSAATATVSGTVSGYTGDGSGITVEVWNLGEDWIEGTATTAAGGTYSATVRTSDTCYSVARQDATHTGRSNDGTPST